MWQKVQYTFEQSKLLLKYHKIMSNVKTLQKKKKKKVVCLKDANRY